MDAPFDLDRAEATSQVEEHRNDLNRSTVSNEHWDLVRDEMSQRSHDKESYEYSISHPSSSQSKNPPARTPPDSEYLLKLEEHIETPEKVRDLASLDFSPRLHHITEDSEDSGTFEVVSGLVKDRLTEALKSVLKPTFIRLSKAKKDLSPISNCPTLGLDTTLPQFRPSKPTTVFPQQDQYPVWYFFYGTLAESDRLTRLLGLSQMPKLRKATVFGGVIRLWAGNYKALVNGDASDDRGVVQGWSYLVDNREAEEALQYYETDSYEVVRCLLRSDDDEAGEQCGLAFRFRHLSLLD